MRVGVVAVGLLFLSFCRSETLCSPLCIQAMGPLPMPAEEIMESWDWVSSAWTGRIAEIVAAQGNGP